MRFIQIKVLLSDTDKTEMIVLNIDAIVTVRPLSEDKCVITTVPALEYTICESYDKFCSWLFDEQSR